MVGIQDRSQITQQEETTDPLMKLVIPHWWKSAQRRPNFSCDHEWNCVYAHGPETICNHESKEQFGEVCALYHAVHNIKSCLCWWGGEVVPHHYVPGDSFRFFRLHLSVRLIDVPKFYNSYSHTAELNTCMVQDPVGVFWDVVPCSLVVYGETCSIRILLKVAGFLEMLVPCYVATLRTSNFCCFAFFFSASKNVGMY